MRVYIAWCVTYCTVVLRCGGYTVYCSLSFEKRSVFVKQLQEFLKSGNWSRRNCISFAGVFYFEPPCILPGGGVYCLVWVCIAWWEFASPGGIYIAWWGCVLPGGGLYCLVGVCIASWGFVSPGGVYIAWWGVYCLAGVCIASWGSVLRGGGLCLW